jgi:hypothetical protein
MILRWPCGRAGPAPRCRPGSAARSAPRRASGRSRPPSRPSPSATLGSPCPCRPHRRTAPRVLGGPGACWCRRGTYLQSARRLPACGADRPAVSCSSTPSSCRPGRRAGAPGGPASRVRIRNAKFRTRRQSHICEMPYRAVLSGFHIELCIRNLCSRWLHCCGALRRGQIVQRACWESGARSAATFCAAR